MLLSELLEVDLVDVIPLDLLLQRSIHLFYFNFNTILRALLNETVILPQVKLRDVLKNDRFKGHVETDNLL